MWPKRTTSRWSKVSRAGLKLSWGSHRFWAHGIQPSARADRLAASRRGGRVEARAARSGPAVRSRLIPVTKEDVRLRPAWPSRLVTTSRLAVL